MKNSNLNWQRLEKEMVSIIALQDYMFKIMKSLQNVELNNTCLVVACSQSDNAFDGDAL